jgi:hypothetical protein
VCAQASLGEPRITCAGDNTCILFDLERWDSCMTRLVQLHFPSCEICAINSPESVSGFMVVCTLQPNACNARGAAVILVVLSALVVLVCRMTIHLAHIPQYIGQDDCSGP